MQQHAQSAPLAVPQCGSCASSVRAWRLWTARHSWEEVAPLSAPPLLLGLELATSKVADSTAFEHAAPPILTLTLTLTLTPTLTPNPTPNQVPAARGRLQGGLQLLCGV